MNKKIFWISSYPKSGNTWMRAIITSLFYTKDGIFNFDLLSYIPNFEKLETFEFIKDLNLKDYNNLSDLNVLSKYWIKSQEKIQISGDFAFFKSHSANMSMFNAPFTNKQNSLGLIYLVRDPRDVALSYSKHQNKSLDEIIKIMTTRAALTFTSDKKNKRYPVLMSRWDEHYISWTHLDVPKLMIKYEMLLNETEIVLEEIIKFFHNNFKIKIKNHDKKIANIIFSTSFAELKKNENKYGFKEAQNSKFFRKGLSGQWHSDLLKKHINLINKEFKTTMEELSYL